MKAMMEEKPIETAAQKQEAPVPADEVLKTKWPELAECYNDKPRLASMLKSTSLDIEDSEDAKTVIFRVVNDAQKDWVESKLLHELEGNYRRIVGSMKIYLRVAVTPDNSPEQKKIYMPSEQAKELMAQNEEVNSLVKDLELDIK
jgi:chromosomal replication initiation ATPase DnaA